MTIFANKRYSTSSVAPIIHGFPASRDGLLPKRTHQPRCRGGNVELASLSRAIAIAIDRGL